MMLLQAPVAASAVRDTIARIVLEPGYQRSVQSTLLSRLSDWFWRSVETIFSGLRDNRDITFVVYAVAAAFAILALIRAVVVARGRRRAAAELPSTASAAALYAEAENLAVQQAWLEAAHRLYAAVTTRLEELGRVRRHPSKTLGDYWRELRNAGDAFTPAYGSFARLYEVVLYGDGLCDAARYAALRDAAHPITQTLVDSVPDADNRAARAA
jgi:hypothetical protein